MGTVLEKAVSIFEKNVPWVLIWGLIFKNSHHFRKLFSSHREKNGKTALLRINSPIIRIAIFFRCDIIHFPA